VIGDVLMNAKDRKLIHERIYPWMEKLGYSPDEEKSKEWRATGRYIFSKKIGNVKYRIEFYLDVWTLMKKQRMHVTIGYILDGEIVGPVRNIHVSLGVVFRPPLGDYFYDLYEELVEWLDLIQPTAEFCLIAQQVSIEAIYEREDYIFVDTRTDTFDYKAHRIPQSGLDALNKRYKTLMDEYPAIAKALEEYGWSPTKSYAR